NDDVGTGVLVDADDRIPVAQIVLVGPGHEDVAAAAVAKALHHHRAEEAAAASDDDPGLGPVHGVLSRFSRSCRAWMSASTIRRTRASKPIFGCQPRSCRALLASPISRSTSVGRK